MTSNLRSVLILIVLLFLPSLLRAYPAPGAHPRLLLREGEEAQVREAIALYPIMAQADSAVMAFCASVMEEPPHPRVMAGFRISNMQEILRRVFHLCYAYRVHGGEQYARRAVEEMLNAADYVDWNPQHFLDVAEITMGMAIGYDWLYDYLTAQQRRIISDAILSKGIAASHDEKNAWFYTAFQNWNQVCNAGLVYGAIALWDEHTAKAENIVDKCFGSNYLTLREGYSQEGAYAEGYGYWGYGSAFQIMLIAGLESAFGSDLGLMGNYPSFYRSGRFMQMMSRPTGLSFNYADCGREATAQHVMAWLAAKTGDTSLLYTELRKLRSSHFTRMDMKRLLPFFLISGRNTDFDNITRPEAGCYVAGGLTPVFLYRSGWDSPEDTYLGIKVGLASSNHSHLDVGSFVFDSDGITWADDLGIQPYLTLESKGVDLWNRWQNSQRYDVFRISPFSHNIITVNGHRPDVYQYIGFSRIWTGEGGCYGAEMDLHMLYWEDLSRYVRSIVLDGDKLCFSESLQARGDGLLYGGAADVRWAMCTTADAEVLDSGSIRLSKNGHSRLLRIVGSDGATPEAAIWSTEPPHDYDMPNPGSCLVGFTFSLPAGAEAGIRLELVKEY